MAEAMLKLPARVRLHELTTVWVQLEEALRAELAQVRSGAGQWVRLNLAELNDFDSGVLTLLLSTRRLVQQQGLNLELCNSPAKLKALSAVYGVDVLLWPEVLAPQAA